MENRKFEEKKQSLMILKRKNGRSITPMENI